MPIPFKTLSAILDSHVQKGEAERREWDRWHAWYMSDFWEAEGGTRSEETGEMTLETNYPYAFIDTMIANVCPTNPLVTINANSKDLNDAARMRGHLINHTLRRDKAHAKSWDMATFAALCGRAISKTVFNNRTKRPTTKIVNPRNFFWDMSTPEFEDTRYTIEAIAMTREELDDKVREGIYDAEAAKAIQTGDIPTWMYDSKTNTSYASDASQAAFKWAIVYEVYDFTSDKMYHMGQGASKPLYEGPRPYKYVRNPYSMMVFNKDLNNNCGVSDVKLIARIQERLNEIDTLELIFAHTCIPVTYANVSLMDNPEETLEAIKKATNPGDIVQVRSTQPAPMESIITWSRSPTMSPSWDKMRDRCTALIEFILGIPQYSRGAYGNAEVATELALVDTATRTRNGRRIRVIEDWIVDVSKKTLGLWKEMLQSDQTMQLRDHASMSTFDVTRSELAFPSPDPVSGVLPEDDFEDEWAYDFQAAAYSPTENHRLVQLQKLEQFMQVLLQNPNIDQQALMFKLTELLEMVDIRQEQGSVPVPQPGAPPPEQPAPAPGPQPAGMPTDVMPSGGAVSSAPQQALEPILPPNSRGAAAQPVA